MWRGRVPLQEGESTAQGMEFSIPTVGVAAQAESLEVDNMLMKHEDSACPRFGMVWAVGSPNEGAVAVDHPGGGHVP